MAIKRHGYELRKSPPSPPVLNLRTARRFLYFARMYEQIRDLEGDVVECGVGFGYGILNLAYLVREDPRTRQIWGFDSFEGFPEPTEEDASVRKTTKGDHWKNTSIELVRNLLRNCGLDSEMVEKGVLLVKGYFENTVDKYTGRPIAFLHLDGDLYESYKVSLEALYPKVAKGGIVLFDEYLEPTFPGATKAIDEYFGERKSEIVFDKIYGKYHILKN